MAASAVHGGMDHVTTPVITATVVAAGMVRDIAPPNASSRAVLAMGTTVASATGAAPDGPTPIPVGDVAGEYNIGGHRNTSSE